MATDFNSSFSGKTILVTGASGFLGTHLCATLAEQNAGIIGISRSRPTCNHPNFDWRRVDLGDYESTRACFSEIRPDVVFHLCSHAQGERNASLVLPTFRGELVTTVHVLAAFEEAGCGRLVMSGSMEEPEDGAAATSPYAAAKAASRTYARMFHQVYGTRIVMPRIFMAYGPGQHPKKIIANCITTLLQDKSFHVANPGRLVDWIYVSDVIRGLLAAASTPDLEGASIDIGSGVPVSIGEVVQRIADSLGRTHAITLAPVGACDQPVQLASVEQTTRLTGWKPTVPLPDGLSQTVEHYAEALGKQPNAPKLS